MTRRWTVAGLAAVATVLLATAVVLLTARTGLDGSVYTLLPTTATSALLGALLVALRPRHPVGWGFLATGLPFVVGLLAEQVAMYGLVTRPGAVPGAEAALWVSAWVYQPALVPMFVLVPLYFPDGRLPSPRWRWVTVTALAVAVLSGVLTALDPGEIRLGGARWPNPYGVGRLRELAPVADLGVELAWLALVVVAVASLAIRFRRADGEQRQQLKWVAYALSLVAAGFGVDAVVALFAPGVYGTVFPVIQALPVTVNIAVCVAILRHRLFDIDLLINRTLVYLSLTACVVGLYVVAVGWLGALLRARGSPILALMATGVVAVAFAPLREAVQRLVNRLLYGHRDEPYRALTLLGRRLEATLPGDAVLPTVVDTVAEALRLPYVAVEVLRQGHLTLAAEHGRRPPDETQLIHLALTNAGVSTGRLTLATRGTREWFSAADRRLLGDLTRHVGTAVHAVGLSADLRRSRERLVLAREEERRRVGRDLHDGLGPQLAALSMKVETARDLIATDPRRAARLLTELLAQAERAVAEVRQVAYTLRPPALEALGLLAALRVHAADQQQVTVRVDAEDPLPVLPAAVEVAAYRIAIEAMHNVVTHSGAGRCTLRLRHDGAALQLEILDDGTGIPAGHRVGVGLASMRERAAELGGSCSIESAIYETGKGGTLVRAVLPSPAADTAADTATDTATDTVNTAPGA